MNPAEFCVNCEEPILGQPVYFDGGVFCCIGCTAGGPCVCTYGAPQETETPASTAYEVTAPAYSAPIASAPVYAQAPVYQPPAAAATSNAGREPLSFPTRDSGLRPIVLRLGGFRDQRDLLEFALALEEVGVLAEVSLTRAEPADAWFAVRAASAQQVLAALQEVRGWLITANASEAYVEGRIESLPANMTPAEPEPVLPQRPRFRVFSPRPEAPSSVAPVMPVTAPATAAPGQAEYERPAVYQQPETVPVTQPVYAAPPVPVLPAPSRPTSVPEPQPERFVQPPAPVLPAAAAPAVSPNVMTAAQPRLTPPAPGAAVAPAASAVESAPASVAPLSGPRLVAANPAEFHQPDMIAADDRPGGAVPLVEHLTLVVYPFHSFVALNEFQSAIRVLRGVTNTRVRRFYRGTLHLAVDYEDVIPLAERLQDLRGFRWQMVSESRQEIELLLEDTGALMAAEGDG